MPIDQQRVAAVRILEALGFTWHDGEWRSPAAVHDPALVAAADHMHAALVDRADALAGCTGDSTEETELVIVVELIEAYEATRWPDGKVSGGKG